MMIHPLCLRVQQYLLNNTIKKRTHGKYKAEFQGEEMICLNSKCYHIWGTTKGKLVSKTSAKGIVKSSLECLDKIYTSVKLEHAACMMVNAACCMLRV